MERAWLDRKLTIGFIVGFLVLIIIYAISTSSDTANNERLSLSHNYDKNKDKDKGYKNENDKHDNNLMDNKHNKNHKDDDKEADKEEDKENKNKKNKDGKPTIPIPKNLDPEVLEALKNAQKNGEKNPLANANKMGENDNFHNNTIIIDENGRERFPLKRENDIPLVTWAFKERETLPEISELELSLPSILREIRKQATIDFLNGKVSDVKEFNIGGFDEGKYWTGLNVSEGNYLYVDPSAQNFELNKSLFLRDIEILTTNEMADLDNIRPIYDFYVPHIGINGIMDVFVEYYDYLNVSSPVIHSMGEYIHSLVVGKDDIQYGLEMTTRGILKSAPLHGFIWETISHRFNRDSDPADIFDYVAKKLCYFKNTPYMASVYISCVHGVGHGLDGIYEEDTDKAIEVCGKHNNKDFVYTCATGVYMSAITSYSPKYVDPCALRFPATCFRFKRFAPCSQFAFSQYHELGCVWGQSYLYPRKRNFEISYFCAQLFPPNIRQLVSDYSLRVADDDPDNLLHSPVLKKRDSSDSNPHSNHNNNINNNNNNINTNNNNINNNINNKNKFENAFAGHNDHKEEEGKYNDNNYLNEDNNNNQDNNNNNEDNYEHIIYVVNEQKQKYFMEQNNINNFQTLEEYLTSYQYDLYLTCVDGFLANAGLWAAHKPITDVICQTLLGNQAIRTCEEAKSLVLDYTSDDGVHWNYSLLEKYFDPSLPTTLRKPQPDDPFPSRSNKKNDDDSSDHSGHNH